VPFNAAWSCQEILFSIFDDESLSSRGLSRQAQIADARYFRRLLSGRANAPVIADSTEVSWMLLEKNFNEQYSVKQPDEIPADGRQQSESKSFHGSKLRRGECPANGEGLPLFWQVERLLGLRRGRSRPWRKTARTDAKMVAPRL